jgi:hypothetical protein
VAANENVSFHDKKGDKLYEKVFYKVIIPMNTTRKKFPFTVVADKKCGYSEEMIEDMLERIADHVEKSFPRYEFRMVQLTANRFNFIATGPKPAERPNES